jgi:hypothetical protein
MHKTYIFQSIYKDQYSKCSEEGMHGARQALERIVGPSVSNDLI